MNTTSSTRPKRAFIAYCALADRLGTPGVGIMDALIPFFAEACQQFAGELFDAAKFSKAILERYNIPIPRLAALGLAEQLAREGLLIAQPGHAMARVYQYAKVPLDAGAPSSLTESEVEAVLTSFAGFCRADSRLATREEAYLQAAFLDRLLNAESMRILGRREGSIATKRSADTIVVARPAALAEPTDRDEVHLDYLVSQFLLDLREKDPASFERASNVAFANMAAEAVACFQEPAEGRSLDSLTVYLDSPLLLDMLGVNTEYNDYGRELLEAIHASGAKAAILDHCVAEAEATVYSQLNYARSGVNQIAASWGTSAKPDLLAALVGHVGARATDRLGIEVHRDPDVDLVRRSPNTVGDIETAMLTRMQNWPTEEAKDYDRKSVWAMLAMRDVGTPCSKICDSSWLFLTRNTTLVGIANQSWASWLKGTSKHSHATIERWAPIAMSDKQFAGYLWARVGGGGGEISKARLLAHCSAAVRPRADVKAKAYNLVLELSGRDEANDLAALLEDREGSRALMRATRGDPEDVTKERLPFILERVRLAAGEYAAAIVREEAQRELDEANAAHLKEVALLQETAAATHESLHGMVEEARAEILQHRQDQLNLQAQNVALRNSLAERATIERKREAAILQAAYAGGVSIYRTCRWTSAALFGLATGAVSLLAAASPEVAAGLSVITGTFGFSFVPNILDQPFSLLAEKRFRAIVAAKDKDIPIPAAMPDFKKGDWVAEGDPVLPPLAD